MTKLWTGLTNPLALDVVQSPTLDVDLDFSPFTPLSALPSSESCATLQPALRETPAPPSPPLVSFPSLPSLTSSTSLESNSEHMTSGDSVQTLPESSSSASLMSFADVDEALGSMLASLESGASLEDTMKEVNPGLGLGLELPTPHSITKTVHSQYAKGTTSASGAFQRSSHQGQPPSRVLQTAKVAPKSPQSGVFINGPWSSTWSISSSSQDDQDTGSLPASAGMDWDDDDRLAYDCGLGLGLGRLGSDSSSLRHRTTSEPSYSSVASFAIATACR